MRQINGGFDALEQFAISDIGLNFFETHIGRLVAMPFLIRLMGFLVLLSSASSAFAIVPVGGPPWYCVPYTGCVGDALCRSEFGPPKGFSLRRLEDGQQKFLMEGLHGDERIAEIFPSLEAAQLATEADGVDEGVQIVLVPDDNMADGLGFTVYSVASPDTGKRRIVGEVLKMFCGDRMPDR
ncbi:hypothetical protein FMN63_14745 [Stappia sp. BW2]|uniref:hypothetical protein n=1 Tax=Stappia sp. BW2 TaxID=2592622 RepID=UPI0011DE7051|nr:hypothetical protein [Stappia sp. BW2]TYC67335.1 hypothetical protein FMN63_14745 [Stappia sp. BW2]